MLADSIVVGSVVPLTAVQLSELSLTLILVVIQPRAPILHGFLITELVDTPGFVPDTALWTLRRSFLALHRFRGMVARGMVARGMRVRTGMSGHFRFDDIMFIGSPVAH